MSWDSAQTTEHRGFLPRCSIKLGNPILYHATKMLKSPANDLNHIARMHNFSGKAQNILQFVNLTVFEISGIMTTVL